MRKSFLAKFTVFLIISLVKLSFGKILVFDCWYGSCFVQSAFFSRIADVILGRKCCFLRPESRNLAWSRKETGT